ncbi:UDP-N-acetylglucosamine--N-acetylmuramyl-(pentapeptide) pyrophosphoryl-undecaprenol N-acetylglucosamine transferase [Candidatus Nesciobacter abundans]|uniref:UDP-N-acetylglucosamine--N-acetylmuramyl-(Pentapeptide) pyrophosphoryl-undecaprenol N-acetylglucosamine transferase n=1 Tax=Candidatus Nesciobacter abundans TaxID=2601668 RepID=A0A5C0UI56_9PROT|nr:UDP-N-acetylglucosamine--N-acetylmuramyl-(pentapeptide) pyrophosphoryl-undecaprenol N-acetylglucosamine transferase [Candidatus Nesciobacter abundans]QEK39072.1 UDP-N-acetylglucosamine--N-acetylmuramyl-(pentapeptide) pyrophosphoryl-undecaprenol N-acetylglucosamine transferase [Candidatus Nesciobacter abundans]
MEISTIVFSGGGTAGHVFTANGTAFFAKARNIKRIMITDQRGYKYVDKTLFDEIYVIPILPNILLHPIKFFKSIFKSMKIIKNNPNSCVIGFGAYISLPACIAAKLKRKKMYIYQGDQIMGKANRALGYFCNKIFLSSFNIKANKQKSSIVGLIPRHSIKSYPIKINSGIKLLVIGSSINTPFWKFILPSAFSKLPKEVLSQISIRQQVGKDYEYFDKIYKNIGFKEVSLEKFIDTNTSLPWSNLVFARAGFSTICDLTASMRPAMLVPWSKSKDNHQLRNALWFESSTGGWCVKEEMCTPDYVSNLIMKVYKYINNSEGLNNEINTSEDNTTNIKKDTLTKSNQTNEVKIAEEKKEKMKNEEFNLESKSMNLSKWMPVHGGLIIVNEIVEDHKKTNQV